MKFDFVFQKHNCMFEYLNYHIDIKLNHKFGPERIKINLAKQESRNINHGT